MNKYLLMLVLFITYGLEAKEAPTLHDEISNIDKVLFDAFNSCELETIGNILSKDLEFYHDTGGVSNFEDTMQAFKSNCENKLGLKRNITKGTLKVFPVKNFGAIQEASHEFCHIENGKNECSTFKFIHIWKENSGKWQLTRVVSYDH
jgi:hypothetical protein